LTAERLARASDILMRLDLDEDEMITREELLPSSNDNYPRPLPRMGPGPVGPGSSFLQVTPGQPTDGLVKQLITTYDKDKNGKLSREEAGLPREEFDALDADKDGQLDAKELAEFFRRTPDLEMMARPGSTTS